MGEDKAFAFWAKLRANGLKVAKGWSEAYYTEFSQNGGKYPHRGELRHQPGG